MEFVLKTEENYDDKFDTKCRHCSNADTIFEKQEYDEYLADMLSYYENASLEELKTIDSLFCD